MGKHYAEKIYRFVADSQEFTFVCHCENTRNGFKHVVSCYDQLDQKIGGATCYYYNRTWERYGYQSAMHQIAGNLLAGERARILDAWKEARGYVRMTAKRTAEFEHDRPTTNEARTYQVLRFLIGGSYKDERPWAYDPACGARENEILRNVSNCTMIENTPDHLVYRLFDESGSRFCDYDAPRRQFVG